MSPTGHQVWRGMHPYVVMLTLTTQFHFSNGKTECLRDVVHPPPAVWWQGPGSTQACLALDGP